MQSLSIRKQKKTEYLQYLLSQNAPAMEQQEFQNFESLSTILQKIEKSKPVGLNDHKSLFSEILINSHEIRPKQLFKSSTFQKLIVKSILYDQQSLMQMVAKILRNLTNHPDQKFFAQIVPLLFRSMLQYKNQSMIILILHSLINLSTLYSRQIQDNLTSELFMFLLENLESHDQQLKLAVLLFLLRLIRIRKKWIPIAILQRLIFLFLDIYLTQSIFLVFLNILKEINQPTLGQLMKVAIEKVKSGILKFKSTVVRGKACQTLYIISQFHNLSEEVLVQQIYLQDQTILNIPEYTACIKNCLQNTEAIRLEFPFNLLTSYVLLTNSFKNKRNLIQILKIIVLRTKHWQDRFQLLMALLPILFEFISTVTNPLFQISLSILNQLLRIFSEDQRFREVQQSITENQIQLVANIIEDSKVSRHRESANQILQLLEIDVIGREQDEFAEMREMADELIEFMETANDRIIL